MLQLSTNSANAIFDYENQLGSTCNQFVLTIVVQDDDTVDGTALNTTPSYTLTIVVLNKDEVPWFNEGHDLTSVSFIQSIFLSLSLLFIFSFLYNLGESYSNKYKVTAFLMSNY